MNPAKRQENAAINITQEKFQFIDIIIDSTEPSTVAKEFAPHAQPIIDFFFSPRDFIPEGKNTPIGKPTIKINPIVTKNL